MKLNAGYEFKLKVSSGGFAFGTMLELTTPGVDRRKIVAELKRFGYDYIWLDLEHGALNRETVYDHVRAAKEVGMVTIVRVEESTAHFRWCLDIGVNGVQLPLVNSVAEAAYAVNQSYLPPLGRRGTAIGLNPYLTDFQDLNKVPFVTLIEYINNNTLVFPMIETLEGIRNLPEILKLEGVTGVMVGPFDLALSIGRIRPQSLMSQVIADAVVEKKVTQIARMCREAGKVAGIGGYPLKDCGKWAGAGYNLFLISSVKGDDLSSARSNLKEAKSLIG